MCISSGFMCDCHLDFHVCRGMRSRGVQLSPFFVPASFQSISCAPLGSSVQGSDTRNRPRGYIHVTATPELKTTPLSRPPPTNMPSPRSEWGQTDRKLLEEQAIDQLRTATSINDIHLICHHFPFQDSEEPLRTLHSRTEWIRQPAAMKLLQDADHSETPGWPSWSLPSTTCSSMTTPALTHEVRHHFLTLYSVIHPSSWIRAALGWDFSVFASLGARGHEIGTDLGENHEGSRIAAVKRV